MIYNGANKEEDGSVFLDVPCDSATEAVDIWLGLEMPEKFPLKSVVQWH